MIGNNSNLKFRHSVEIQKIIYDKTQIRIQDGLLVGVGVENYSFSHFLGFLKHISKHFYFSKKLNPSHIAKFLTAPLSKVSKIFIIHNAMSIVILTSLYVMIKEWFLVGIEPTSSQERQLQISDLFTKPLRHRDIT